MEDLGIYYVNELIVSFSRLLGEGPFDTVFQHRESAKGYNPSFKFFMKASAHRLVVIL